MGSDQEGKQELDVECLLRAETYVDRASQCAERGELRAALAAGVWDRGTPPELGDVILGQALGRRAETDVTICDLTGTGVQDTRAIAGLCPRPLSASGTLIRA